MNETNSHEELYPHSHDVAERESADGGYSRGWGRHFQPRESGIADMHGHIQFKSFENAEAAVKRHMELVRPLRIARLAACLPVSSAAAYRDEPQGFSVPCVSGESALMPYFDVARKATALKLFLFLHYANPDTGLVRWCAGQGARGVKLHNAAVIVNAADPEYWLSSAWDAAFSEMGRLGLPVLWHVAQRMTDCPYTGGGRNTYWKDGWKKGVAYTNEDLLQVFLKVVRRHPDVPFIGAHQLHVGWERLDELFASFPNLYADTSIGCWVNDGDAMYESDVRAIRQFFTRHSERMLFGTDYFISDGTDGDAAMPDDEKKANVNCHIRFIRQLRLPQDALQNVFSGNAEKLMKV